ncbi:MAG: DUF1189 family protein [Candidatus Omnitrophica bacterium]|nr:DUF1189 family protein [Candidatus Omnitrophota bacterium]
MDILLAPIFSFFSVSFYRRVIHSSLGKGFLNLLFLAFIYSLVILSLFMIKAKPAVDHFVDWFTKSLPQLTFTREGVHATIQQPFEMKNPVYGTVLVIDTTKDKVDNPPSSLIYLTKTQLVVRNEAKSETRIFNLVPPADQAKSKWKDFSVTGTLVDMIYRKVVPFIYPAIVFFVAIFFFMWKLLASLIYSLFALLLNLFRKEKLNYGQLLVLSMFAVTPVAVLQCVGIFVPKLLFALKLPISMLLTILFIALGILATQKPAEDVL